MSSKQSPVRNWCFTSFNEAFWVKTLTTLKEGGIPQSLPLRYIVAQLEKCPDTGRLHWQGYIELTQAMRMAGVKKLFEDSMHLSPRRGTPEQARDYCMKEETRIGSTFEIGTFKGKQGKRSDWDEIKEEIQKGYTYTELLLDHPGTVARNSKAVNELMTVLSPSQHRVKKTTTIVIFGDAGAGKSHLAKTLLSPLFPSQAPPFVNIPAQQGDKMWFDGYNPDIHERVIINEFSSQIHLTVFNELCDEHDYRVQVKGGTLPFLAKELIFTSNDHIRDWYPNVTGPKRDSFLRRLDYVFEAKIINGKVTLTPIDIPRPKVLEYVKPEEVLTLFVNRSAQTPSPQSNVAEVTSVSSVAPFYRYPGPKTPESVACSVAEVGKGNTSLSQPAPPPLPHAEINSIQKNIMDLMANEKSFIASPETNYGFND